MRYRLTLILGSVALVSGAALAAWLVLGPRAGTTSLAELIDKTRASLIYIEGGSFYPGNYHTHYRKPDGTVIEAWAADYAGEEALPEVTLDAFYLSAYETSHADFNAYLRDKGYPLLAVNIPYARYLPDRAVSMSYEEASDYCAWLGGKTGIEMRLPTEAEWEFAARNRGEFPIWPTDNGSFEPGRNIAAFEFDLPASEMHPPIGYLPPNPLGLFNLADGLYEWVAGTRADDPQGAAIFKGGSDFSTKFYERIPGRGISERMTATQYDQAMELLPADMAARLARHTDPLGPGGGRTTARCLAPDPRPPTQSGFGRPAPNIPLVPPYFGVEQG